MSKFDERVEALINDRVNELERLFLSSEKTDDAASSMGECCEEVLEKVNEIKETADRILEKLRQDNNDPTRRRDVNPDDLGDNTQDTDVPVRDLLEGLKRWILNNKPYLLPDGSDIDYDALPSPDDSLPAPTGGSYFPDRFFRTLYRGLSRLGKSLSIPINDLIDLLPQLRGYLQLLRLLIDADRAIRDMPKGPYYDDAPKWVTDKIESVQQKIDALAPIINALTVPSGGEGSVINDRLQDILDNINDLLQEMQGMDEKVEEYNTQMHNALRENFALVNAQAFTIRGLQECANRWIFGNRDCEEFDSDIITRLDVLERIGNSIKCTMDEYYNTFLSRFQACCESLHDKLDEQSSSLSRLERSLLAPGNPIDRIGDDVERGNVVGTGSLVLNYQQDMNIIKSQLAEIRRLL